MIACPGCGFEAADDFAFCPKCATKLAMPRAIREERKVVTSLFCDLVAFTAMSEAADPEEVDALLRGYYAVARKVIESHGGTVEKFIGDAVVGVFGVPAAHEDDPERAVRAGLRLVEALEGMTRPDSGPLQVRVGVNTGEALVRLDVTPGSGEGFLTGDAVNVAARLQAAAPPGGVVVGAATRDLSTRTIVYEELPPVTAKGKAEQVSAWLATAPVSRMGIDRETPLTPLVGRDTELAHLEALFERVAEASSPQTVLIVGEPGIGKSRLVAELFASVDERRELVTWRQGRCLAYGEGVTFSALSEIVRAHAGVLDTDDVSVVECKLDAVLPEGADREWFRQRLRALLGLEAPQASREENLTAWRRFLEGIAAAGPTVLVVEDLHCADEALLDFLEYLAGGVAGVPLLLVMTARHELFERRLGFASTARVERVALEALSQGETEELVASCLEGLGSDAETSIAARAAGNPFYAEESARLVRDRARAGGQAEERVEEAPLAGSIQAVIAARLDSLAPEVKAMLADASVAGEVFWDGLLTAMGERAPAGVDMALIELAEKHLVHRVRSSSMVDEREFAFGHAVAREVAYGQLPRAVRAKKHAAVAEWIEAKTGERAEDLAEVLSHHYSTALDLATATKSGAPETLVESALHYLTLAGDRTLALDCTAAETYYGRALELAQAHDVDCAGIRFSWGKALGACGRDREAASALREAAAELEAKGDVGRAAMAMALLAGTLTRLGDPGSHALLERALRMLDGAEPSPELVFVLERRAGEEWVTTGDPQSSLPSIDRAIEMAAVLGLPQPGHALFMRGAIRCETGDAGGLDDLRRAVENVRAQGLGDEAGLVLGNYCSLLAAAEGPAAALKAAVEAIEFARRRGMAGRVLEGRGLRLEDLWLAGSWDEALEEAAALDAELDRVGSVWLLVNVRMVRIMLITARGDIEGSRELTEWITKASPGGDLGSNGYVHQAAAAMAAAADSLDDALDRVADWAETPRVMEDMCDVMFVPVAVRVALNGGDIRLAERLLQEIKPVFPSNRHALASAHAGIAESGGDFEAAEAGFADAARSWRDFGVPYEEGHALLGQGRCLVALSRAQEAAAPLTAAREIFARLGAKPALAQTDAVLAAVSSAPDRPPGLATSQ